MRNLRASCAADEPQLLSSRPSSSTFYFFLHHFFFFCIAVWRPGDAICDAALSASCPSSVCSSPSIHLYQAGRAAHTRAAQARQLFTTTRLRSPSARGCVTRLPVPRRAAVNLFFHGKTSDFQSRSQSQVDEGPARVELAQPGLLLALVRARRARARARRASEAQSRTEAHII